MAHYISDTGIVSPQPSKLLDASTKRGIETRRKARAIIKRWRARKAEHKAILTQADIDGREADWAEKSDSFNSRIARLP